jgi:hypothetical protein
VSASSPRKIGIADAPHARRGLALSRSCENLGCGDLMREIGRDRRRPLITRNRFQVGCEFRSIELPGAKASEVKPKNRIELPRREEKAALEIAGSCLESASMEVGVATAVVS